VLICACGNLVPQRGCERRKCSHHVATLGEHPLSVGGADVLNVSIDRKTGHPQMEHVQGGAAVQKCLLPQQRVAVDLVKQLK
jgi:hypothetical protein